MNPALNSFPSDWKITLRTAAKKEECEGPVVTRGKTEIIPQRRPAAGSMCSEKLVSRITSTLLAPRTVSEDDGLDPSPGSCSC